MTITIFVTAKSLRSDKQTQHWLWKKCRTDCSQQGVLIGVMHWPALRRIIWSFWQRSMKPEMRLANSTTYWIALVMWIAHCCHITSADWKRRNQTGGLYEDGGTWHDTVQVFFVIVLVKLMFDELSWTTVCQIIFDTSPVRLQPWQKGQKTV